MRVFAITMLLAAVAVGCGVDAGTSPPPLRIAPSPGATLTGVRAEDGPRTAPAPAPRSDGRAVLMRLSEAGVRVPGGPPLLPTSKSFVNPWATDAAKQRGVDLRLNWQSGQRNEWVLEAALAIPFPASGTGPSATWELDVPPGARLDVDLAIVAPRGVHVGSPATVTLAGSALPDGPAAWSLTASRGDRPLRRVKDGIAVRSGTLSLTTMGDLAEATLVWVNPQITAPAPKRPNLLLIVVDSQRADTVGPGATQAGRSALYPAMERLYEHGTGFRHAFSAGNLTRLSTFAFLTGQTPRYGRFHSTAWDLTPEDKDRYYEGEPSLLGTTLRAHGYRSAAVGNDVFLFGHLDIGLDADFDTVWDYRNSTEDTPWMTDRAIDWLEARQRAPESASPFFLLVNYNAPHKPYDPPPEAVTRLVGGLRDPAFDPLDRDYLGEIAWVEMHMDRLLAALGRLGLTDDTIVAFTADHGEVMNPLHKCYNATLDKYCFRNHGQTLFDEELHVPLAVTWPGRIPAGRVLDVPVSLIDLAPTFHTLAELPADPRHVGRDLSPMLLGGPELPEVPVRAESRRAVALRTRWQKYVWNDPSMDARFRLDTLWNPMDGSEELYDLESDPMELHNLAPLLANPDFGPSDGLRSALLAQDDALEARRGQAKTGWVLALGAGRLSGRITTLGRFEDVQGATRTSAGSKLTLDRIGPAMVRFRTVPADIPVHLELTLDGAAVTAEDIGIGAYGLRSLTSLRLDDATVRAAATAPETGPTAPPALLPTLRLWRVDQDARAVGRAGDAEVDDEVRAMMTTWGYQ
ncbi:MAG: sulfatase-like hydrolase/transferase [Myxococcales bacterium]|nr:sulfatase-like hydrolase/transferase [Myxococcales bacterium]